MSANTSKMKSDCMTAVGMLGMLLCFTSGMHSVKKRDSVSSLALCGDRLDLQ